MHLVQRKYYYLMLRRQLFLAIICFFQRDGFARRGAEKMIILSPPLADVLCSEGIPSGQDASAPKAHEPVAQKDD